MKSKGNESTSTFFLRESVVNAIGRFKYNSGEEVTFAMRKSLKNKRLYKQVRREKSAPFTKMLGPTEHKKYVNYTMPKKKK